MNHYVITRVVDDHRPGRLVDLEILTDFKIMVDRVGKHNRQNLRCLNLTQQHRRLPPPSAWRQTASAFRLPQGKNKCLEYKEQALPASGSERPRPSVRRLGVVSYATVVTGYNRLTGHFLLKSRPQDYGRLRNRQQLC